jgi:dihydroxy-acid dehydratase
MGFGDEDFERPVVAIVSSWTETAPGHYHLRELAAAAKEGVREAGGMPVEFNTVAPCDGIAQGPGMHYVLPLRDVIAASVELMIEAHRFDAALFLGTCDKIVPGMLMAAARVDLPSVFLTGGPMLPWHDDGQGVVLSDVKEGMGARKAGRLSEDEFRALERNACGGPGACAFMGTANTMSCLVEAMGLSLPGCATLPGWMPGGLAWPGRAAAVSSICGAKRCGFARSPPRARWETPYGCCRPSAARPTPCSTCWLWPRSWVSTCR